jgi:flagellar assembly factor FliW
MQVNAGILGTLEVNEDDLITFEKGIIGFENLNKFAVVKGDDHGVFYWLQSLDDEEKRFVLMNTSKFISDYKPITENTVIPELGKYDDISQITVYNVTVIPDNFMDMTVNLKAPVLINTSEKKGFQFISDNEKFPIKYYIQRELQKLGAGE